MSLFICLLAAPTRQAQQEKPAEQEGKPKPPPISSHVILITINGLRSDFVTGAESQRLNVPTIQALRSRGSYAVGIESVFPSQTLPAHASMITGSPPADHWITSDYPFDQEVASQSDEPRKSAREIKTETVFDVARRAKLVVAAVGFPLTNDAAITFNQPGAADDFVKALSAADIIEKHHPNLLLVNFTSFDEAQRRHGLLSAEALRAMEAIDGLVKKIIDATENSRTAEETTFILVSDSGASKVEKEFNPNVLLAKKGWLASDGQGRVTSWQAVAQSFGGSAAVFVKDPKDEDFIREVETFFNQQAEKPDSPIWRIITRREATKLGADPRAVLYLDAAPFYAITAKMTGSSITNLTKGAGRTARGYAPSRVEMRALFVIAGKGIKSGAQTQYARLIDIAPTVARLLGLEMKTARGRVISEVIQ
ncbi:MAG TPA: alkaline phosphatase family protein [Blastocatellia bacterium]|nr:alkaline phosphatase family protein [Blastocatellia bacterium]